MMCKMPHFASQCRAEPRILVLQVLKYQRGVCFTLKVNLLALHQVTGQSGEVAKKTPNKTFRRFSRKKKREVFYRALIL